MPDRVDASEHPVQPPGAKRPTDHLRADSGGQQLVPANHTVLTRSQARHGPIASAGELCPHTEHEEPTTVGSPPSRRAGPATLPVFVPKRATALLAAVACAALPSAAPAAPLKRPTWLPRVVVTEYYPVPERWFVGRRVRVAGLSGAHRVDWLFSARGVTMEGDGIGLDGRRYHVRTTGFGGWVDRLGRPTRIGGARPVFWRSGGFWRNARGHLTFPLEAGGWSNGRGLRHVPLLGVSFAPGPSRPLRPYRSLAVDPRLIPMGSSVYIPAYRRWFVAQDTGGAILGRHVDVFRPAPASPTERSRHLVNQRILVVPPGQRRPAVPAG
jgi:3D (Asp-Asp-Asp) domain-containing protein